MTRNGSSGDRWTTVARVAGLVIIAAVILLRAVGRMEWQDAQFLLGIAAALLGVIRLLRGGDR